MLISSFICFELLHNQWLIVRFNLFIHEEIIDPIRFPGIKRLLQGWLPLFAVVWFNILKDDKPLSEAIIYPSFVYVDDNSNETILRSNGLFTSGESYAINQSSELDMLSFKPSKILGWMCHKQTHLKSYSIMSVTKHNIVLGKQSCWNIWNVIRLI